MARRLAAILLIALALATLAVYARAVMAPLTLSIGSQPIALVQNGTISTTTGDATAALPLPSTAGTTLIAVIAMNTGNIGANNSATGWTAIWTGASVTTKIAVLAYFNNPGGILSQTFAGGGSANPWYGHMSEWSGIADLEGNTQNNAAASAGTTLSLTIPVDQPYSIQAGDIAFAVWIQQIAVNTATFTTPPGYTRLIDNGATSLVAHMEVDYKTGMQADSTLAATMTSNRTTTDASGVIFALTAAPPVTDQTAMLAY